MFLLLLLLVVVEERLRALWGEVRRKGARALAALGAAGPPRNGGNGVIRGTTRRRHAANQLLMLQNPHRSQPRAPRRLQDLGAGPIGAKELAQHRPSSSISAKKFSQHSPSSGSSAKKFSQQAQKRRFWGVFKRAGRTFSRSRPPSDHAGRTFSRTRRDNVATLKPTTPLHSPEQQPLKPPSPLHPKTAPKQPISHPQRRWRFQATGRPGRQGLTTVPVGGGGPWPGDQWAADVANVVKPTQFISPHEDPCYKRRQSKPKNSHFQRKSPRIDDVRNNGAEIHTKNTLD